MLDSHASSLGSRHGPKSLLPDSMTYRTDKDRERRHSLAWDHARMTTERTSEPAMGGQTPTSSPTPAVVVYQNPDFVSGLLQHLLGAGLLESAETEEHETASSTDNASSTRAARGGAKVGALGQGFELGGDLQKVRDQIQADESQRAQRLKYVFSQAYYLNYLRHLLAEQGRITTVRTYDDAAELSPGDLVEYSSTFQANEINAVLDIATPELVSAVTKYVMLERTRKELRNIPGDDHQALIAHRTIGEQHANDAAELSSAIAHALRQDFRSEHTREFYGFIDAVEINDVQEGQQEDDDLQEPDEDDDDTDGLIAVTICDAMHFLAPDPDRLLDGQFTVLGKVISGLADDVPVLDRNKLLDRVDPEFLEATLNEVSARSEDGSHRVAGTGYTGTGIDLQFSARITGSSFAVLPIAIYA